MILKRILFPTLLLATVLTASCAIEPNTDSNYSEDRVMKAWINTYYPTAKAVGDTGVYLLETQNGNGVTVPDSAYVQVHFTKFNLDGSVVSTNDEDIAGQNGQYAPTSWYGGNIWRVDQGYLPEGLEQVIKSMRSGAHFKAAIPASASSHDYSAYTAFSSTSESVNHIIDVTIDTVYADIYAYQERVMRQWFILNCQVPDTVAEHLYLKKLEAHESSSDTIASGTVIKVRYIGRMMNGQVFDTNIEDTAKFYRIWSDGGSYDALSISYYPGDEDIITKNSVVDGFAMAIARMNYNEKAVTLFGPQLGYGESGSSPTIPEYSPLVFWLWIEQKQ